MPMSCACADLEDAEATTTDSAYDEQHMQESRRKLDNTKLKFYGANPTVMFEDDLRNNAWVKNLKSSEDWIRVVRGSVDAGNVRAKPEYTSATSSSSSSDSSSTSSSRRASSCSSSKGRGDATVQLSVAAQVDCLIDLATDPNVMGRAFYGLSLWI
jgi:FATC domain